MQPVPKACLRHRLDFLPGTLGHEYKAVAFFLSQISTAHHLPSVDRRRPPSPRAHCRIVVPPLPHRRAAASSSLLLSTPTSTAARPRAPPATRRRSSPSTPLHRRSSRFQGPVSTHTFPCSPTTPLHPGSHTGTPRTPYAGDAPPRRAALTAEHPAPSHLVPKCRLRWTTRVVLVLLSQTLGRTKLWIARSANAGELPAPRHRGDSAPVTLRRHPRAESLPGRTIQIGRPESTQARVKDTRYRSAPPFFLKRPSISLESTRSPCAFKNISS